VPAELDHLISRLLAWKPANRPQTASEVIVALERLNLASPILSLVDRQEALRDPTIRLRVALSQQVTQLDGTMVSPSPVTPADLWHLELTDSKGRTRHVQVSTVYILESLRKGKLSNQVRVSRDIDGPFLKLEHWPEFKAAETQMDPPKSSAAPASSTASKESSRSVPSSSHRSDGKTRFRARAWWIGLLVLGAALVGILVVVQWLT
jgi:serine/threonine protein kinase